MPHLLLSAHRDVRGEGGLATMKGNDGHTKGTPVVHPLQTFHPLPLPSQKFYRRRVVRGKASREWGSQVRWVKRPRALTIYALQTIRGYEEE